MKAFTSTKALSKGTAPICILLSTQVEQVIGTARILGPIVNYTTVCKTHLHY